MISRDQKYLLGRQGGGVAECIEVGNCSIERFSAGDVESRARRRRDAHSVEFAEFVWAEPVSYVRRPVAGRALGHISSMGA